MSELEIIVRPSLGKDEIDTYIIPSWLNSYAQGFVGKLMRADSRHAIGRERYWTSQRLKIERILSTQTVSVRVATYDDEPIGWICDDQVRREVHFVFTNRNFRRQGVAKALVPGWVHDASAGPVFVSHLPPPWYSRQGPDPSKRPPWREHVCLDLITAL